MLVRRAQKKPPGLTPRLFMLREGDRSNLVEKITGFYTLEGVKPGDNVLFLSTGTGEGAQQLHGLGVAPPEAQGKAPPACCVRYRRDLGYLEIQQELMQRHHNYRYLGLTTRAGDDQPESLREGWLTSGQIEEHLGDTLDPRARTCFCAATPR